MADSKADQQGTPKPGDIKPVFGAGVQNDANKADADKADASKPAPSPKTGGQGVDGPVEIPGGAYIVNGQVLDANGNARDDYEVKDGAIVKKGDAAK